MAASSTHYKRMVVLPENEYTLLKHSHQPITDLHWPSDNSVEREQKLYALALRQDRESDAPTREVPVPASKHNFEIELNHFPKTSQSRAKRLLTILERYKPFISWNNDGEVSFGAHEAPVSGSRLTDLLYHATAVKRRNFEPTGWSHFLGVLQQLNVPSTALSTTTLQEMKGKQTAVTHAPSNHRRGRQHATAAAASRSTRKRRQRKPAEDEEGQWISIA